ncbi:MAG: transglycosylase domain-containing protein, partial [Bacteroidota bacterium]
MNNFEHKKKKYLRIFWVAFITPIVVIALLFYLISAGKLGYMPKFEELENPNIDLATQIITEDHELLGKFFLPRNNRTNVPFSELSPYLVNALISIEDIRFYQHSGIDPRGVARAFFYLGKRGGASTITQQLAKLLYHQRSTNFFKQRQLLIQRQVT